MVSLNITAERIYLTRGAYHEIFFFFVDGFKSIDSVALYVFTTNTWY